MNRLRFGLLYCSSVTQALFPRRWLPACSLVLILPALLLFGLATGAHAELISVYDDQVQGYINPLAFGQNVFFGGNYLWDHQEDEITRMVDATNVPENTVKARIEALAPTILRFPGGTAADLYLWEDGLGFRNTVDTSSTEIVLDGAPQYWGQIDNAYNTYRFGDQAGTVYRGLLIDKIPEDGYKRGDAFNFTGIESVAGGNKKLTTISHLNGTHPAGASVRPGARPGQYHPDWNLDQYHRDHPDPNDFRPDWLNTYGIVEHMRLVNYLGAEALVTVNYMTGLDVSTGKVVTTAPLDQKIRRAQALVAFCNGRTNDTRSLGDLGGIDWHTIGYWARKRAALGFPHPFDVRYWEVGNEPYFGIFLTSAGPPKVFQHPAAAAATYANQFIQFAQAMKKVDPKIRVGAAGMTRGQGETDTAWTDWNTSVLNGTQNDLDFLSIHPYYPTATRNEVRSANPTIPLGEEYIRDTWYKAVMAGASQALSDLHTIRNLIDTPGRLRKNNIGLAMTEYGLWPTDDLSAANCSHLAAALYAADLTMGLIQQNGPLRLTAATSWNMFANDGHAAIGNIFANSGIRTRPQYYALQMLREALVGKRLVNAQNDSSYFWLTQAVGNVGTSIPVQSLGTWAAVSGETTPQSLALVVINRTSTAIDDVSINLGTFAGSPFTVNNIWFYGTLSDFQYAHNEPDNSATVVISTSDDFPYNFPPYSLTVYKFTKPQQ